MAATYTASAAQTVNGFFINPPKYIENGMVLRSCSIPIPFSASNTCTIQMMPIPKGAQVYDLMFAWDTAGTTTQFTASIGDNGSVGRYLTSGSFTASGVLRLGGAAGSAISGPYANFGYSYSADSVLQLTVTAVASGSTTPAGNLRLSVLYTMDQSTDGNS